MSYATPSTVFGRDTGRTYGPSTKPTASQVGDYIDETAAELDAILRAKGYLLPVAASSALKLLEGYNAIGAIAMVEMTASSGSGRRAEALELWERCKRMLMAGEIELDAGKDTAQSNPRGGFPATALFIRDAAQ